MIWKLNTAILNVLLATTCESTPHGITPKSSLSIHRTLQDEFDPASTLTSYVARNDCGPRGVSINADLRPCTYGAYFVKRETGRIEDTPSSEWNVVATIDDCEYVSYDVYECLSESESNKYPFDPSSTMTHYIYYGICGPRGNDGQVDLTQCPSGGSVVKVKNGYAPGLSWHYANTIETINGCGYLYYSIYECNPESSPPSLAPTMTPPGLNSWDITSTGNATEETTSKDTILIRLPFNSTNRKIGALGFEKDCITAFNTTDYPYFITDTTTPSSTHPDGYIQFNTTLEMNVTSINSTKYWNTFTDGTRGGWVEACIETFLTFEDNIDLGNDDSPEKVVFRNTVLNISVSLSATYEVDAIDVEREGVASEIVSTDYSKFITAYECDETDLYARKTTTYNQGDEITICVRDDSTDIVQVEEFVDLVVAQSNVSSYNYINNRIRNPDITTPVCVDGSTASTRRVCYAKIRALARFFGSENPDDLTISGSVYVTRDGRRLIRNLHNDLPVPENNNNQDGIDASGCRVQEGENGSGAFGLTVGLGTVDDTTTSGGTVESMVACLMTMAVGAAGASLMV